MDKTKQVLQEMLTENTGEHFLDSGGAYGRNWQRNQGRNFDASPETTISFRWGFEVSHSVFHWLASRLEYDGKLDHLFYRFATAEERKNDHWLECLAEWVERKFPEAGGIYGDGEPITVNTYNHESLLSQVIQYMYLEDPEEGPIVILQIHGGCDVRGGYTRPRVFRVSHDSECAMFDDQRADLWCEKPEWAEDEDRQTQIPGAEKDPWESHSWYTDDGYHWYANTSEYPDLRGYNHGSEIEIKQIEECQEEDPDFKLPNWENGEKADCIYVTEDGDGLCPHCGGKLQAGFW